MINHQSEGDDMNGEVVTSESYYQLHDGPVWARTLVPPDVLEKLPTSDDIRREVCGRLAPLDVVPVEWVERKTPGRKSSEICVAGTLYGRRNFYGAVTINYALLEAGDCDKIRAVMFSCAEQVANRIKEQAAAMPSVVVRPVKIGMLGGRDGSFMFIDLNSSTIKAFIGAWYWLTPPGEVAP